MDIALSMGSCDRPAMNTIPVFYATDETVFPDMTPDGYRSFCHLVFNRYWIMRQQNEDARQATCAKQYGRHNI